MTAVLWAWLSSSEGEIECRVGDRFRFDHEPDTEWAIVALSDVQSLSDYGEDGTPTVTCRLAAGEISPFHQQYMRPDGTIEFNGDAVARAILGTLRGG